MEDQLSAADKADATVVTKDQIDAAVKTAEEELAKLEAPYQDMEHAVNALNFAKRDGTPEEIETATVNYNNARSAMALAVPRRVVDEAAQKLLNAREGNI